MVLALVELVGLVGLVVVQPLVSLLEVEVHAWALVLCEDGLLELLDDVEAVQDVFQNEAHEVLQDEVVQGEVVQGEVL